MPSTLGIVAAHRTAPAGVIPMTGLVGWWDADDAATITYSSGTIVSQWRDKSGGNRHFTATGSPNRNVTQNGRAAIAVAASSYGNNYFATAAPVITTVANWTMIIACKRSTVFPVANCVAFQNGDAASGGVGITARAADNYTGILRGGLAWHTSTTSDNDGPNVHTAHFDGTTWGHYVNGTATNLNGTALGTPNTPTSTTTVPGPVHSYVGDIYEAIAYSRVLSTVERQQVETYLTTKWIPPTYTDVLSEPFNNFTTNGWATAGTPTIVAGRTGTAARLTGTTDTIGYAIPAPSESDTITVGFAYRTNVVTTTNMLTLFRSDAGATTHNRLSVYSLDGSLRMERGTASNFIAQSAPGLIAINTWYYIETQIKLHDTAGFVKVRLNGVEVINASALDTKNGGTKTVYDRLTLSPPGTSVVALYDDLYLTTGAGAPFKGDHTIP